MKTYLVGGAVRDKFLGVQTNDNDWVVVGGTHDQMIATGFSEVGAAFPVYLHPETGEEYALARRERKTGAGYHGFSVEFGTDVTIKEDLMRRDLTINAIAIDTETGEVVDPYGGRYDIERKVLRHVSEAFAEDPLRVIRLARFYARYAELGFSVAPETIELAKQIVKSGELEFLSVERFWVEIMKAFTENGHVCAPNRIKRFFEMLDVLGVTDHVEFFKTVFASPPNNIAAAAANLVPGHDVELAVAITATWNGSIDGELFLSTRAKRLQNLVVMLSELSGPPATSEILSVFKTAKAFQALGTMDDLLYAMEAYEAAYGKPLYATSARFRDLLNAARTVTSEPFQHLKGPEIGKAMDAARVQVMGAVIRSNGWWVPRT